MRECRESTWHFVQDKVGDIVIIKKDKEGNSRSLMLECPVIGITKSELKLGSAVR